MTGTIEACNLCPRQCGVRREPEQGEGFCRMGALPVVGPGSFAPVGGTQHQRRPGVGDGFLHRLLPAMRILSKTTPSAPAGRWGKS